MSARDITCLKHTGIIAPSCPKCNALRKAHRDDRDTKQKQQETRQPKKSSNTPTSQPIHKANKQKHQATPLKDRSNEYQVHQKPIKNL